MRTLTLFLIIWLAVLCIGISSWALVPGVEPDLPPLSSVPEPVGSADRFLRRWNDWKSPSRTWCLQWAGQVGDAHR